MKLHVHNHTMVIYTQYKFLEIPFICSLVMTEDGKTGGRTTSNLYSTPFGGGTNWVGIQGSILCEVFKFSIYIVKADEKHMTIGRGHVWSLNISWTNLVVNR